MARQACNALSRMWRVASITGQDGYPWWTIVHTAEPWELGPVFRSIEAAMETARAVNEERAYFRSIPMIPLGSAIPRTGEE